MIAMAIRYGLARRRQAVAGMRAFLLEHPGKTAVIFHNMLLADPALRVAVGALLPLFAEPQPTGLGVYNHHDGYRP